MVLRWAALPARQNRKEVILITIAKKVHLAKLTANLGIIASYLEEGEGSTNNRFGSARSVSLGWCVDHLLFESVIATDA